MQLYFIRHGQSANNAILARTGYESARSEDPELTPNGHLQARHLARFLAARSSPVSVAGEDRQNVNGFDLTHLYCSLMVRAVATAAYISDATGVPTEAWEDVHEEWGIYLADVQTGERVGLPGKNRAYFEAHYPNLILPDGLGEQGWWNHSPELPEERIPRARRFVCDLLARHGNTHDRVAVVSHGGFYQCVLAVLFNIPLLDNVHFPETLRFSLNNGALTRVDFTDKTRLVYANRLDFMPRELIT